MSMSDDIDSVSSSEDDFDILTVINSNVSESRAAKVESKLKGKKVVNEVTQYGPKRWRRASDELKVVLPDVFKTEGERHEQLMKMDSEIKKDIRAYEDKLKSEYDLIQHDKEKIEKELRDDGTDVGGLVLDNSRVELIVDRLVRTVRSKSEKVLNRKFFFYNSPYFSYETKTKCSLPFQLDGFFFSESNERIIQAIDSCFIDLFEYSILQITDLAYLRRIKDIVSLYSSFDYSLSVDKFLEYLKIVGGDTNAASHGKLKLKLCSINENVSLSIWKSFIVFKFALAANNSQDILPVIQRAFFLSVADYNLNTESFGEFGTFVEQIFMDLLLTGNESLQERENVMAEKITYIFSSFQATIGVDSDPSPEPFVVSLIYNILRCLNLYATHPYAKAVVDCLNASFLKCSVYRPENDYILPHESSELISLVDSNTYPDLNTIKKDLTSSNPATPDIYLCIYYRIQILPYIFTGAFIKDRIDNTNTTVLEHLRTTSLPRMKELQSRLGNIKARIYHSLSIIGNMSIPHENVYYKSLIVRTLSESFFIYDKIGRRIAKDVSLIEVDDTIAVH